MQCTCYAQIWSYAFYGTEDGLQNCCHGCIVCSAGTGEVPEHCVAMQRARGHCPDVLSHSTGEVPEHYVPMQCARGHCPDVLSHSTEEVTAGCVAVLSANGQCPDVLSHGTEEVPEGCVAVLSANGQCPDVLSHSAVRARNMSVLLAACYSPEVLIIGLARDFAVTQEGGMEELSYNLWVQPPLPLEPGGMVSFQAASYLHGYRETFKELPFLSQTATVYYLHSTHTITYYFMLQVSAGVKQMEGQNVTIALEDEVSGMHAD
eukprot:1151062-Pelagomonas_calceolata.AAC.1